MITAFEKGRRLYLVVRNEKASDYYTADSLCKIFEEEGGDLFDVRPAIIGHSQQGGSPSPFDRTHAVRLVSRQFQVRRLLESEKAGAVHIGQKITVV